MPFLDLYEKCEMCNGDGKVGDDQADDCPRCGGEGYNMTGKVRITQAQIDALVQNIVQTVVAALP